MDQKKAIAYPEGQRLLYQSAIKAMPFNIIQSIGISAYLAYSIGIKPYIIIWLICQIILSLIRMMHSQYVIRQNAYLASSSKFHLNVFTALVTMSGLVWTSVYFFSLPYVQDAQLYVIVLTIGGLISAATVTLAIYYPAFIIFISVAFIPPIIHTYLEFNTLQAILATMWLIFLISLNMIGSANRNTLQRTLFLTEQNKQLAEDFQKLSITDPLTGLYNRRHFERSIEAMYLKAVNERKSLTMIAVDIDYFKLINDNLGHPFGDKFIIYTAEFLRYYLGAADTLIFRVGGDEFVTLIMDSSLTNIKKICAEIVQQFKKQPRFSYVNDKNAQIIDKISMSIGVVHRPATSSCTVEQIIEKADRSLYQSKNEGKNQIHYEECQ